MFRKPFLPGLLWTVFIAALTLVPGNYIPRAVTFLDWLGPDKLLHLILFGTYIFLLLEGFSRQSKHPFLRKNRVLISLIVGIVFAFFTETMQKFVIPGRNGNIYDFIADIAGSFLGYAGWSIIRRNEKKNLHSSKKYN
jgi:VanZ family protein